MINMRNMNRLIVIFACLLALAPINLSAQEKTQPAAVKKAPMAYEAFFKKDMQKFNGTFPIYRNGEKYYLEIPASTLGRDLLVSGSIVQGGNHGMVSSVTNLLIFHLGRNNTLEVHQQICSERAKGDLAKAIEAANLKPVATSFPIVAFGQNKGGYIIDITSDVNSSGKLFSFPNMKSVNTPAADRSGVDSVYVINNGVKFTSLHAQTDLIPGFMHIPPRDQHTTALIEWSLQLLPERHITARESDPRVGYATISYADYDRNPYGVKSVREIQRWHLAIKPEDTERYRRGELVEPANPIRVYLDRTLSSESERRAVMQAVAEWNRCFEAAGFKNALQVQNGQPEVTVAYHQIVYSYAMGKSQFSQISDSRTGEIFSGNIVLSHKESEDNLPGIQLSIGGYEPAVLTDSMPIVREEYIRYQASKLTGQLLGLQPNWAGSAAFTTKQLRDAAWARENGISASVTDGCVVNFAAQPGDGIALRDLFSKASIYDRWAIEWGYRQYPGMDASAEKKALNNLAAQAKDNTALYFATKEQADYRVNETDLGQNVVETATLGLKNMERLSSQLSDIFLQRIAKDDTPWTDYIRILSSFNGLYISYFDMPLNYIGGISVEPVLAGYNEQAISYLPKQKGEEVMAFLNRQVFQGAPAWRTTPVEVDIIGNSGETKGTGIFMSTFRSLMNPSRLHQLVVAQDKASGQAYTINDLFKALESYVFLNYSASRPLSRYQVQMQYNFVREFVSTFSKLKAKEGSDDLSYFLVNQGQRMKEKLDYLGKHHQHTYSHTYYRGLSVYLTRAMKSGKLSGMFEDAKK